MPFPLTNDQRPSHSFEMDNPGPIITDKEYLIRRAFAVDVREGYQALFRQYYQALCSQAARFVYSREVAEDIVSDVFFNVWKNRVHEQITTSFRAYLFTAVRNRAYNYLQETIPKNDRMEPLPEDLDLLTTTDDPHQILQLSELYNRINEEVRLLSPQCQRVFIMSRFEGKPHREIAGALNISPKTIEVHILKALAHLRRALLTLAIFLLVFA